jgi:hypothetical protein
VEGGEQVVCEPAGVIASAFLSADLCSARTAATGYAPASLRSRALCSAQGSEDDWFQKKRVRTGRPGFQREKPTCRSSERGGAVTAASNVSRSPMKTTCSIPRVNAV